jgi:HD-GYP domain-containing protein (c-di-GMP phosphodiesterase class II)
MQGQAHAASVRFEHMRTQPSRDFPMQIAMDALSIVFSKAFDIIETEQVGTSEHHSMRVAVLCALMGKRQGFDGDALAALTFCALFHDNALTEYILNTKRSELEEMNLRLHCEYGQRNVAWLPFMRSVDGFVLYHHECESGNGPFGKRAGEFPFEAALIAAADQMDALHHLQRIPTTALGALRDKIAAAADFISTRDALESLLEGFDSATLESLRDENIGDTLKSLLPPWKVAVEDISVIRLAGFIARVIDCKSHFTRKHTEQIANRAWLLSGHYGYADAERAQFFLAAALHDIGKIATPLNILEKPGSLAQEEFNTIKQHAHYTYDWLGGIEGLGNIWRWASQHHEKIDGSGYPLGLRAEELDFNSRLLACIDIYQAVCEERPYHAARSHRETMPILYSMAGQGKIDEKIVKDMDEIMAAYSLRDIPPPLPNTGKASGAGGTSKLKKTIFESPGGPRRRIDPFHKEASDN